jgi:enamine deaminase RidA (YjgF/YER057c/UK114 family)
MYWRKSMPRILAFLSFVVGLLALATAAAPDRKYIVLKRPTASNAPFSEAVLKGDTLYLSGHIGLDPATGKPERRRRKKRGW